MSPDTVLAIGNEALALLGAQPVAQVDEGTDLAATLLATAPTTLRQCLAAHPWRCTLAQVQLARLTVPPLTRWRYAYALPVNLIALRRITASSAPGAPAYQDYAIIGETVQADADALWADVQAEPPLGRWPPHLVAFARAALAADLALTVTASTTDAELWHRRAWGQPAELGQGGLFGHARRVEAQQAAADPLDEWPLVAARLGG